MCVDYESSELLLYQNMVIQDSGDIEQALVHLNEHSEQIFDKVTVKETYGKNQHQIFSQNLFFF